MVERLTSLAGKKSLEKKRKLEYRTSYYSRVDIDMSLLWGSPERRMRKMELALVI